MSLSEKSQNEKFPQTKQRVCGNFIYKQKKHLRYGFPCVKGGFDNAKFSSHKNAEIQSSPLRPSRYNGMRLVLKGTDCAHGVEEKTKSMPVYPPHHHNVRRAMLCLCPPKALLPCPPLCSRYPWELPPWGPCVRL